MNIAATGGFAGGGAGGILTGGGDQLRPLEDALNLVAPVGNPFALDPNASAQAMVAVAPSLAQTSAE